MRKIRIYQPGIYQIEDEVELTPEGGQHVATVLRSQVNDCIYLFNGDNKEYSAQLTHVSRKKVKVLITACALSSKESPCQIHLFQGISKGERMEWVVQKAVELGVHSITPLITERCVVRLDEERLQKKLKQWQAIAISACEQSGRNFIPQVQAPRGLQEYAEQASLSPRFVLSPTAPKTWRDNSISPEYLELIVGPEGGLSEHELAIMGNQGFHFLSLGPRILRTETAAIVGLTMLQAQYGDL